MAPAPRDGRDAERGVLAGSGTTRCQVSRRACGSSPVVISSSTATLGLPMSANAVSAVALADGDNGYGKGEVIALVTTITEMTAASGPAVGGGLSPKVGARILARCGLRAAAGADHNQSCRSALAAITLQHRANPTSTGTGGLLFDDLEFAEFPCIGYMGSTTKLKGLVSNSIDRHFPSILLVE